MIIENQSTEIGDKITIKADVPILGLIALKDFYDSTVGETADKYFDRKFRYSLDGINYTDWKVLTHDILNSIIIKPTNVFIVEYQYQRAGTDISGSLKFIDNTLEVEYTENKMTVYEQSVFNEYFPFGDEGMIKWCLNVLEKIYKPGIIPKYIERNKGENKSNEDEDYLSFWRTITCFFSLFVNFARLFENFESNNIILKEYLKQRGIYFNSNSTREELLYLFENYWDNISERGTRNIIKEKGVEGEDIDGELKRIFGYNRDSDEVLFKINPNFNVGWCINKSSPLYRGIHHNEQITKGYELTQDFVDLSKYPLINPQYCSIVSTDKGQALKIDVTVPDFKSGIGVTPETVQDNLDKFIKINRLIDYEVTFWVKQEFSFNNLSFEFYGVDENYNKLEIFNTVCLDKVLLNNDLWHFVRIHLFSSYRIQNECILSTNLNKGINLNNTKEEVVKIIPCLYLDNFTEGYNGNLFIYDFKFKPSRNSYSLGFINSSNIIEILSLNNNGEFKEQISPLSEIVEPHTLNSLLRYEKLEDKIKEFLLPYGSVVIFNWLKRKFKYKIR